MTMAVPARFRCRQTLLEAGLIARLHCRSTRNAMADNIPNMLSSPSALRALPLFARWNGHNRQRQFYASHHLSITSAASSSNVTGAKGPILLPLSATSLHP